jgi:hypothetical protein
MATVTTSETRQDSIDIDKIIFDIDNPRIQLWLQNKPDKSEKNVLMALGAAAPEESKASGTTITSLKNSIRTSQGIVQPIIVRPEGDDKYKVIEGNTRLMIYREFREKGTPGDWGQIPAIIRESVEQKDIEAIRLQAHLVGPRQWDPYSKAKYLKSLEDGTIMPFSEMVEYCGGDKTEVLRLVNAYEDMENHYRPVVEDADKRFDPSRFSAFVEVQKVSVKTAIEDAGFTDSDFAKWVMDKKIHPLNTVRALPRILVDAEAKNIFLKEGAKAAVSHLDSKVDDRDVGKKLEELDLQEISRHLTQMLINMTRGEEADIYDQPNSEKTQSLVRLLEELNILCDPLNE